MGLCICRGWNPRLILGRDAIDRHEIADYFMELNGVQMRSIGLVHFSNGFLPLFLGKFWLHENVARRMATRNTPPQNALRPGATGSSGSKCGCVMERMLARSIGTSTRGDEQRQNQRQRRN